MRGRKAPAMEKLKKRAIYLIVSVVPCSADLAFIEIRSAPQRRW
jgi:hypothetical protein